MWWTGRALLLLEANHAATGNAQSLSAPKCHLRSPHPVGTGACLLSTPPPTTSLSIFKDPEGLGAITWLQRRSVWRWSELFFKEYSASSLKEYFAIIFPPTQRGTQKSRLDGRQRWQRKRSGKLGQANREEGFFYGYVVHAGLARFVVGLAPGGGDFLLCLRDRPTL